MVYIRIKITSKTKSSIKFYISYQHKEARRVLRSTRVEVFGWVFRSSSEPELDKRRRLLFVRGSEYYRDDKILSCPRDLFDSLELGIEGLNHYIHHKIQRKQGTELEAEYFKRVDLE